MQDFLFNKSRMVRGWLSLGTLVCLLGALSVPVLAQSGNSQQVRIVRLSSVEGKVQVLPGDDTEFEQAYQNMPLIEGSRIETGDDGKAEIEFEDGSVARLTPNSALTLDQLGMTGNNAYATQMTVAGGMVYMELRQSDQSSYVVQYADGEFSPEQNSTVRISLDAQPPELAVIDGMVMVDKANAYSVEVHTGESVHTDQNDPSRYFLAESITPDSWDQWNSDMDQQASSLADNRTTARDDYAGDTGYGWSDLDAYGSWYPVPGYGLMWQPAGYGSDFDPYGYGYWAYYPAYGYIWVSGYPWGWTPFYCGNWYYVNSFGWGWQPGMGCRGYGYGWGGGFYSRNYYNIRHQPVGYRPPPRPIRGPGVPPRTGTVNRLHVVEVRRGGILPTRVLTPGQNGFLGNRNAVVIAGKTVEPLKPIGRPISGLRKGSTLSRDFPVNSVTRQPVVGTVQRAPQSTPRTGVMRPTTPQGGVERVQPDRPQTPQNTPRPIARPAQPAQQLPRPESRPEQRPQNQPQNRPQTRPQPRPEPRQEPRSTPRVENTPRPTYRPAPRPAAPTQPHFSAPPQPHLNPPPQSHGGGEHRR